jgi:hypothetical protein
MPSSSEIKVDLALAYTDHAVALGKKGDTKQEVLFLAKAAKLAPDNKVIQDNFAKAKQKGEAKGEKHEGSAPKKKSKAG